MMPYEPVRIATRIFNRNRTVGAMLSGRVTMRHGAEGLPPDTIQIRFNGSAYSVLISRRSR